jgi:hypothetical protein
MEVATSATRDNTEASFGSSGVSWGAVLAGAFVAAALALILLLLGSGLGFSAASPWANEGASAKTLGVAAIVWMVFVHLSSSAIGGYMAGRLRTRWTDVHTNEVFFRDTAHGLTAWAVGIVITAAFLTSAATSIVGGAAKTGAAAVATASAGLAAGAASKADDSNGYFVDSLFRSDRPRQPDDAAVRQEATRIFASGLGQGELSPNDRSYLAQVVAARTGLSPPDAEKRVSDAVAQAKAAETKAREAADAARKAAATLALATFLALLTGAFVASYAATMGGRLRDSAVHRASR